MKTTLKWVLPIGAALSIVALFGLAFFNRLWMGQRYFPMGYDMMRRGSHHAFVMPGASYGGLIVGAVLLMVVLGIIFFVASRSKTQLETKPNPNLWITLRPGCRPGARLEALPLLWIRSVVIAKHDKKPSDNPEGFFVGIVSAHQMHQRARVLGK